MKPLPLTVNQLRSLELKINDYYNVFPFLPVLKILSYITTDPVDRLHIVLFISHEDHMRMDV